MAQAVIQTVGGPRVDLVVDSVGAATLPVSLKVLLRGGRLVTCGVTGGAAAQAGMRPIYWNQSRSSVRRWAA